MWFQNDKQTSTPLAPAGITQPHNSNVTGQTTSSAKMKSSNFLVNEMSLSGRIVTSTYDTNELLHRIHGIHRSDLTSGNKKAPNYRDLRRLDFSYTPSEDSTILIRKSAVLLSFHPIRAIVTSDCLFILLQSSDHKTIAELITGQMKVQ